MTCARIIGNISEVITAVAGQKIALKNRMKELQEYIVARKLPKDISIQVSWKTIFLYGECLVF